MGLDTTHDAWHGAYSAFTRWRNHVAEVAGYAVADVKWDNMGAPMPTVLIDWGHVTDANLQGEWSQPPADPLIVLIAHSDCDGLIHPREARLLADRLETLLPNLNGGGGGHIGSYREKTEQFIKGLRDAAEAGEDVEFR